MLLNYIFGPSEVKYDIVGNNMCGKLHAVIDCLYLLRLAFTLVSFG